MSTSPSHETGVRATALPSWAERNRGWLTAVIARLHERLKDPTAEFDLAATIEPGFAPALFRCAQAFGLSPFERELLLLVAALELDDGLCATVARLNGGASSRASFGLAMTVLAPPHWDALAPQGPLRFWRLVEPDPQRPLVQATLKIDERILHFITGVAAEDERLHGIARYLDPAEAAEGAELSLARQIADALRCDDEPGPIIVLRREPPDPAAQRELALAAAVRCGRAPLWIAASDLPGDPALLATIARHIDREAAIAGALPLLAVDAAGAETLALGLVGRLRGAALWLSAASEPLPSLPQTRRVLRFDVPPPDRARTLAALGARWRRAKPLAVADGALAREFARAAAQFQLGPAALDDIVLRLEALTPAERPAAIWALAREAARGGLDELARRIVTRVGFDDLVLPPAHLAALSDIARQLRQRERVFHDWGFADKHPRGVGLTALFAGESGTGKTLAAEAIANDAGLDLYRVDLAMLVSKYIGETEKNLKRLFDAAEISGAVLLFDEADALFGKRSEVKDSHDRYANIEVAYLLQRIEAYRGLAILTTNMKSALDRAFLRRIRFVVNFPFPDPAARERIWRLQFPPRAPVGGIDFTALARLNLSGGHIRNVALDAAFRAADAGSPIDQALLIGAARAEFAKLERNFNDPSTVGSGA